MNTMAKFVGSIALVLVVLGVVYTTGPKPSPAKWDPELPAVPSDLEELESLIEKSELALGNIKPDNQSRIIWTAKGKKKTPYSIVYLHGFTASYGEGDPVHRELAQYYGCNLYVPRLSRHGLDDEDAFVELTPQSYVESVRQALAVGRALGDKVIVVGTSTGGLFALALAASYPQDIEAVVLYSPLIDFVNPSAYILAEPWGLQLGRFVMGSDYATWANKDSLRMQYWYSKYRLEGLVSLASLVNDLVKPELFSRVTCPVFLGYYYKSETEQDNVVSVAAMRQMFTQLGTTPDLKREIAFPLTGDHVIASHITSKDWKTVRDATMAFLGDVVGLNPTDEVPNEVIERAMGM